MAVATFDYNAWAARYPELAPKVASGLAAALFAEAGVLYLNNTDASPVEDVATRGVLLNMLVAHMAALGGATDAGAAGIVGRISSVTEGSVTIASEYEAPGSQAWFAQTKYGAAYWAATAAYRTMQYAPGPAPYSGVPGVGPWGGRRWPI